MRSLKIVLKYLLALFFLLAGVNHFIHPAMYLNIMPPYLPWHSFLVDLSGFFEIILGGMVLVPKLTRLAAWSLILLLIAIFPANIHMAMNAISYPDFSPLILWLRLPLQGVLIAWVYWYTRIDNPSLKK